MSRYRRTASPRHRRGDRVRHGRGPDWATRPPRSAKQVSQLERDVGLALLEKAGRGMASHSARVTLAQQVGLRVVRETRRTRWRTCPSGAERAARIVHLGRGLAASRDRRDAGASHPGGLWQRRSARRRTPTTSCGRPRRSRGRPRAVRRRGRSRSTGWCASTCSTDPYRIMLPPGRRLASARTVELTDHSRATTRGRGVGRQRLLQGRHERGVPAGRVLAHVKRGGRDPAAQA